MNSAKKWVIGGLLAAAFAAAAFPVQREVKGIQVGWSATGDNVNWVELKEADGGRTRLDVRHLHLAVTSVNHDVEWNRPNTAKIETSMAGIVWDQLSNGSRASMPSYFPTGAPTLEFK